MKRVALYARFSSELQSNRSIEDQFALCRAYAKRQGWTVIDPPYAVSGASVHGRFAFERLVADARHGVFDIILAEDLDRLSRNQADIAALHERMTFIGVALHTVADGPVNEMHIGLKGTMSALFLKALALKIHRGMAGRVRAGKVPGGLAYGYRVTATGEREIIVEKADIIRRIFRETLAGRTPREIAHALNREEVPSPSGGPWNASTINGSRKRGNGILRNELYAGRLVWNRQKMLKNPDTGRRITKTNPVAEHMHTEVHHLRIVDEATWGRVQEALAAKGREQPAHQRRPRYVFTGLVKCGACGGSYISIGGKYPKLGCSRRRERGDCDNNRAISVRIVEDRILSALDERLLDERVVAEVMREYVGERRRLKANAVREAERRERRLAEIGREVKRHLDAMGSGDVPAALVGPRLFELGAEKASLDLEAARQSPDVLEFHPSIPQRYRELVRNLRASLADRSSESKQEVIEAVRNLIDRVVVYPRDDAQGRDLELVGQLAGLLGTPEDLRIGMGSMVAEERYGQNPHPAPVLFRLRAYG